MSRAADRIPLTGADAFLLAFDRETRRRNRADHLSQIVLRLAPGFDPAAFERVLRAVALANPILRAPVRRRLGIGLAEYRLDLAHRSPGPIFEVHDAPEDPTGAGDRAAVPALFERRLNELYPGRPGGLLRADAVRYADGRTDLAFTWLHMLLDGFGSERFLEFLEACRAGTRAPDAVPAADHPEAPPDVALPASSSARGTMAMEWQRWMWNLGRLPVRSPAGPEHGARQDLVIDRIHFTDGESAHIQKRASAAAGFLTPMIFYLAAAIRAHHAVLRDRPGGPPASYVVPLPVNLRPKGTEGGIFRTRVSLLWFQVASPCVDDLDALLGALRDQRLRAIRTGQIENGVAAMHFARHAPSRLYGRFARRALRGELCSFFFAYTGEFCPGLDRFFGAPVEDGFGVPSVPASPGSGIVLAQREGRLSYTHVRQRDAWRPDELELFRAHLAVDLLG